MTFRKILTALFLTLQASWCFSQEPQAATSLPLADQPSSLYTGFSQLLDDDKTLVLEELIDLDENVKRIAMYHNGDRLHRAIPKQVHLMIENKLMHRILDSQRFELIQCIECRITQVQLRGEQLEIGHAAESNQQLRRLGKKVRADAFLFWNASVHDEKFTINLRMVDARDNSLLWLKEYSKKTTREQEQEGFDLVTYELTIGSWGVSGERDISAGGSEEVDGVTVIGLRRREATSIDEKLEYTLAIEHFRNFSETDNFDVSGINLEGRIIADLPSLDNIIDTRVYLGLGQSFYNDSNSLVFRFGFEFPFFSDGFIDFGMVSMPEKEVKWKDVDGLEEIGKFGGTGYDLTLGLRF